MSSQHSRHNNVSSCATAVSFNSATFNNNIYHKNTQTLKWFRSISRLNNPIGPHLEYISGCVLFVFHDQTDAVCQIEYKKYSIGDKINTNFPHCPWVLHTNSPVRQSELASKAALIKVCFHYTKLQRGFLLYESCQPWQNNLTTWVKNVQLNI